MLVIDFSNYHLKESVIHKDVFELCVCSLTCCWRPEETLNTLPMIVKYLLLPKLVYISLTVYVTVMGTMSTIPCSNETRQLVMSQKRGGITYDQLLREMVKQYDPEVISS